MVSQDSYKRPVLVAKAPLADAAFIKNKQTYEGIKSNRFKYMAKVLMSDHSVISHIYFGQYMMISAAQMRAWGKQIGR